MVVNENRQSKATKDNDGLNCDDFNDSDDSNDSDAEDDVDNVNDGKEDEDPTQGWEDEGGNHELVEKKE